MIPKILAHNGQTKSKRRKKGIASIIGMALFLLLFAMAISYVFFWFQNNADYINTLKIESSINEAQIGENLVVTPISSNVIDVTNPTSQEAIVTQVWSNHNQVWNIPQAIPPFQTVPISLSSPGNGAFSVVTSLGNIFYGGGATQLKIESVRLWNASLVNIVSPPPKPVNLTSSPNTMNGTFYLNDLSFEWKWTSTTPIGLAASTTIMKTSPAGSMATLNFYVDQNSLIQVSIDGILQQQNWYNWTNYAFYSVSGSQYSIHNVTVYYYYGGMVPPVLKLNVENASFVPDATYLS